MRGIVHVHIGGTGSQMGVSFWQTAKREHGIEREGYGDNVGNMETLFVEATSGRYFPRCIFADMDASRYRDSEFFHPHHFVDLDPNGSNYSNTRFEETRVPDLIRKQLELMSRGSVYISHGTNEAHGSGTTSNCMQFTRDAMGMKTMINTFSVLQMQTPIYDSALSIRDLNKYASTVVAITPDQAMVGNWTDHCGKIMSSTSCCDRFQGKGNAMSLLIALTPFPNQKYFTTTLKTEAICTRIAAQLLGEVRSDRSIWTNRDGQRIAFAGMALIYRWLGVNPLELDNTQLKNKLPMKASLYHMFCTSPLPQHQHSLTAFSNSTRIVDTLDKIKTNFEGCLERQAWLHWYGNLEPSEFDEAREEMQDIINSYQSLEVYDAPSSQRSTKNG